MMKRSDFTQADLDKPITVGFLLRYFEEYLLPRLAEALKEGTRKGFEKLSKDKPD